jgi:hypothetical protein
MYMMSQDAHEGGTFVASVPIAVGSGRDLVACRKCALVKAAIQVCLTVLEECS